MPKVSQTSEARLIRGIRRWDLVAIAINGIIGENDTMNAATLPKVQMPNRDGFINLYPGKF